MTTSSAAPRIGPNEHEILRTLDRSGKWVFQVKDLGVGLSKNQIENALSAMTRAGLVERVERGTYVVMPRSGRRLIDPADLLPAWLGSSAVGQAMAYALIGRAAAEAHRLTLDTPRTIEVQLTRPKEPVDFQGTRYRFTRSSEPDVVHDNVQIEVKTGKVNVASPGKTLVLLLRWEASRNADKPAQDTRLALEMLERGETSRVWDKVKWPGLVKRHGNAAACRRLGFLLERQGQSEAAESLRPLIGQSGNVPFNPLYPSKGQVDRRWRLILNDPILEQQP
jgi:predicted transcriptional regulator of viral defense system